MEGSLNFFFLIFIAGAAYLFPALVAAGRKHHNGNAITALNVLLGWTFIGWVVALVWSLTAPSPRT